MLAAGWGRIVNVSAAIAARPGMLRRAQHLRCVKGRARSAHTQPRRRARRHGRHRQRVPPGHGRHLDASVYP
jgi:hypothetical protein